jgi:hypothetical protein
VNTSVPSGESVAIVMTGTSGYTTELAAVQDHGTDSYGQTSNSGKSAQVVIRFTVKGGPGSSYTIHGRLYSRRAEAVATCTSQFFVS